VVATARRGPRGIVVTGYNERFVSRARQAGADVVCNKPVVWSALADTLAQTPRGDGHGQLTANDRYAAA